MLYPTIYETRFGDPDDLEFTKCDARINSGMMKKCMEVFHQELNGPAWRIRIEDQHDDEATPHYVLDIGHVFNEVLKVAPMPVDSFKERAVKLFVEYCDNYSCEPNVIEQALGVATVWVCERDPDGGLVEYDKTKDKTYEIAKEYVRLLGECLPDYYIVTWIREEL